MEQIITGSIDRSNRESKQNTRPAIRLRSVRRSLVVEIDRDGDALGPGLEAGEADLLVRHHEGRVGARDRRGGEDKVEDEEEEEGEGDEGSGSGSADRHGLGFQRSSLFLSLSGSRRPRERRVQEKEWTMCFEEKLRVDAVHHVYAAYDWMVYE